MSSRILDSKHFDSVEQTLINKIRYDTEHWASVAGHLLTGSRTAGREISEERLQQMVFGWGDTMRKLQVLCVCLQYKEHYAGTLDLEIAEQTEMAMERKQAAPLSVVALYKAISSILYQIETEHLKELRMLTTDERVALKITKKLHNALAHYLAQDAEGYEEAEWCIENEIQ